VSGKVVDQQSCLWVGVQQLVRSATKEPSVRVERGLDKFRHELTKDAAAVDAGLIQTSEVHQSDLHP